MQMSYISTRNASYYSAQSLTDALLYDALQSAQRESVRIVVDADGGRRGYGGRSGCLEGVEGKTDVEGEADWRMNGMRAQRAQRQIWRVWVRMRRVHRGCGYTRDGRGVCEGW